MCAGFYTGSTMTDIVLTTINAKYIHTAFGLRYLQANLQELKERSRVIEFTIAQRPADMLEEILSHAPAIVGIGVYIWNVELSLQLVAALKLVRPDIRVVLGGPEVSHEVEGQPIVDLADHVITGEADHAFRELCRKLLAGESDEHIIRAPLPAMDQVEFPYDLYTDDDIKQRVVYVEASRGCPFRCEFCLSSLSIPVRKPNIDLFLKEMEKLFERGLRHFKFVDRTFNLNLKISAAILEFFLERYEPGLFIHFEMIPDRLPAALREIIAKFPAGALQFEVGIQTFNPEVSKFISRRQNYDKLRDNLTYLRESTGVHIHADLIVGLPGEDLASFAEGFDELVELSPQEIQVGILKRLRGTPIVRHDEEWEMRYSPFPPYEILQNKLISFAESQRMRRFAQAWDRVANSGNFVESAPLIWEGEASAFAAFLAWTDWLYEKEGKTHGISLKRMVAFLFSYFTEVRGMDARESAWSLLRDYQRGGKSDIPVPLRPWIDAESLTAYRDQKRAALKRQARHLGEPA